ncbi:putative nuclease HARBI1 [Pleurodeles waltl]|uniref:putative nuclease HARBI1 n=1 Tax=Pleurodeles waltl TaxID=8319 RepID=UPI003709A285
MLASGSFQTTGSLVAGGSQPSISVYLPKVLDAIIRLTPHHICFPNSQQLQQETKQGLYLIAGFPHVLGAMDCTHVQWLPADATKHIYRNRKHTHSINVQAIVDHRGLFTNISAKYPGSVHDAYIFRHSTINEWFQDGQYADQGYGIQLWVMTPFANPDTNEQPAYNEAHRKTRNVVERSFGLLKSRFRCLDMTGGSLLYAPPLVCKVILVCAIVHNMCVRNNIPWDGQVDVHSEEEEEDRDEDLEGDLANTVAGVRRRQTIADNF